MPALPLPDGSISVFHPIDHNLLLEEVPGLSGQHSRTNYVAWTKRTKRFNILVFVRLNEDGAKKLPLCV